MPTVITGDPLAVSSSLVRTINGATNASPIIIQTTVAHLYATFDSVVISGVLGNTAANGTWQITVIDSTHYSLDDSVGNGVYVSGGTSYDQSLTPQFQIPSDADVLDAASVNVAFEALADRTQFLAARNIVQVDEFLVSGTWTCPADCYSVDIEGCGGGGGGCGSSAGSTTDNTPGVSGSGGGGAPYYKRSFDVAPGTLYNVIVGAGGAGSIPGAVSAGGGGPSFFNTSGSYLSGAGVYFSGGGGGYGIAAPTTNIARTHGGNIQNDIATYIGTQTSTTALPVAIPQVQQGGQGGTKTDLLRNGVGGQSPQCFSGAVAGTDGTNSTLKIGGAGGGSGGGGPYGAGAAGGNGGNAGATTGVAGAAGGNAADNSSAGGGGAGAGGGAGTTPGAGASGGNGGSGKVIVRYTGVQAVVT